MFNSALYFRFSNFEPYLIFSGFKTLRVPAKRHAKGQVFQTLPFDLGNSNMRMLLQFLKSYTYIILHLCIKSCKICLIDNNIKYNVDLHSHSVCVCLLIYFGLEAVSRACWKSTMLPPPKIFARLGASLFSSLRQSALFMGTRLLKTWAGNCRWSFRSRIA
jgi:hypothetical protein